MKKILLFLMTAAIAVSCSPFVLKSSGALNGSDLTAYKSFKMQSIIKDSLPAGVSDLDLLRLYRALGNKLVERGYTYVEADGTADMTVYVGLSKRNKLETDVNTSGVGVGIHGGYGYGYGPGYYGPRGYYNYYGATPYVNSYFGSSVATTELVTSGVLVVDLVDNKDNNHIFYAQISADIDGEKLVLKDNEVLAKVANKAFKKFPVPEIKKKK